MKKIINDGKQNKPEYEAERCVMCERRTEYAVNVPIFERIYYSEGAGQLCEKCYYNIYIKNDYCKK